LISKPSYSNKKVAYFLTSIEMFEEIFIFFFFMNALYSPTTVLPPRANSDRSGDFGSFEILFAKPPDDTVGLAEWRPFIDLKELAAVKFPKLEGCFESSEST
jgi:hypothetical protein